MRRSSRLLIASMVLMIVIASLTGFAVGKLTPVLRLVGATHATLGDLLHIHGQNFIVGETVILTHDSSSPLAVMPRPTLQTMSTATDRGKSVPGGTKMAVWRNTLTVGEGGTFDITILVQNNWGTGSHTIAASEVFGLLRAQIPLDVLRPAPSMNAYGEYTTAYNRKLLPTIQM